MTTNEILIVLVAGAIAALVKSTTGMGYPLVMLPVLALFIGVAEAIVIVAPSNFFLNAKLVWKLQEHRDSSPTLKPFLLGAIGGAIIGTLALPFISDVWLRIILVGVIVVFLLNRLRPQTVAMSDESAQRFAGPVGGVAGLFQGAAGVSGPIVTPWFLSVTNVREVYIFSVATVFAVSGLAQLAVFVVQSAFTWTTLALAASLIPLAVVVFPLGGRLRDRISVEGFERIILVLLAVSAVSLVVKLL